MLLYDKSLINTMGKGVQMWQSFDSDRRCRTLTKNPWAELNSSHRCHHWKGHKTHKIIGESNSHLWGSKKNLQSLRSNNLRSWRWSHLHRWILNTRQWSLIRFPGCSMPVGRRFNHKQSYNSCNTEDQQETHRSQQLLRNVIWMRVVKGHSDKWSQPILTNPTENGGSIGELWSHNEQAQGNPPTKNKR